LIRIECCPHRIAGFPAAALAVIKERANAIALPPAEEFRRDSDLFLERARSPEAQSRIKAAVPRGFQTRDGELDLARMLSSWVAADPCSRLRGPAPGAATALTNIK
jgi:hypothetical protein